MSVNETGMINPFCYSGELWDSTTSLQYLRARRYDPSIGRFISQDSYEGEIKNPLSLNQYVYTGNNPLIYVDSSGQSWEWVGNSWQAVKDFSASEWQILKEKNSSVESVLE